MGSTNSAKYNGREVTAIQVMAHYDSFDLSEFKCVRCGVQVEFNRGTDLEHPHFQNLPRVSHLTGCPVSNSSYFINSHDRSQITTLISTILTNAKRLQDQSRKHTSGNDRIKQLSGPSTKKMIYQLNSLTNERFEVLPDCADVKFRTEDNNFVKVNDLILTQDEALDRLKTLQKPFICIVRGAISKPFGSTASGGGYRIALSTNQNGQYGNKTKFYLYVPKDYVETNVQKFDLYQRCLILCYGEIEFYNDTPQMKIYSLSSQMVRGLTFPKQQ